MRENMKNLFSRGRGDRRRCSQPTSPTGEPPSNDSRSSSISPVPVLNERGAERSVSAATVTAHRTESASHAPIARKPVPSNDLISPLELGSGEGSSVLSNNAARPPRLESRRASHTGRYGDLHSGVSRAERPTTARAASTGRHASFQEQPDEMRGSGRGVPSSSQGGGGGGGGGASFVPPSRRTSVERALPPPPPQTSDSVLRSETGSRRGHRIPSAGNQGGSSASSLPPSRQTSLDRALPPTPTPPPRTRASDSLPRSDGDTGRSHRGPSVGSQGVGGVSSLPSSRQTSRDHPLPPIPPQTSDSPSQSDDETGASHRDSSDGSQGGGGVNSPSSSQRTIVERPLTPPRPRTPELVSLCNESLDGQSPSGGRQGGGGASPRPPSRQGDLGRSLHPVPSQRVDFLGDETARQRWPSLTDPAAPPRPLPEIPEGSPPRSPTRLRPADQESVNLVFFSPQRRNPAQLAPAVGGEGSGQPSSTTAEDNSAAVISTPNLAPTAPAESSAQGQESPARPGRTYRYVMEDDSSSEEAPESPFTPPGPIPNPIVYQNRLEPQSGTPTPRNASASESRDTSGNLPQFPTLEPTPITAIDIQNALAGFVNSDDNDDDDRTPIAQQPSAPIAQQPSTPPFPDPDSPTLRIYKTEPPRTGPGFNGSVAPVPPPDAHNRSHIWIRPHRIPEDEEFMIPTEYNDLFTLTDATRESMMPRTHRYPDYARDEEARRRKLDFEAKTGETMSDEDYYSLFDQTTSTGGMLSTLLEFMQGREYVKAAHVNRIIHQMNRMMYESAQEEARLRHRRKLECDSLRRQLKDSEERCSDLRKTVGFIKGRTTALGEVASSWKRISEISEKEDDHIRENMGHWVDSDGASARVEEDFRKWQVLDNNLMSRLDERQQIEDTIGDERSISAEDLVRLRDADATIEKQRKEFQKWMEHRTKNLIEWLEVNDDDDESEAKAVLNGIHQELVKEGKILNQAYDSLKSVAGLQLSQRELRNRPLIDVSEQVPSDQALSDSNIYEDSLGADPDTPRQVSPSSLEDDSEGSTSEKSDATVVAPREDADCAGCRRRDRQLREKDRKIQEQTNQLRVGFHNWTQLSRKAEQLRLALTRCNNDSIEDALRHITNYRTLIFRDFYDEMAHLERIFNMQVDRAEEHAALFIKPIEHLQEGGGPEEILKQLEAMGSSVESLADASRVVQQKFSDQLKKMWSEHKEKFYEVTQENVDDAQRQRDLIKNLKKQVAELTEHAQGSLEHDAQESFRVAAALEKQMKAKIGQIRDKVQRYRDEIRRQQKQCDADQSSTQSADPEVARELKKKEKELRNLDRQCTKAAQLIGRMETDLENAKELANVRKQDASVLAEQVADLQLQLEERDETERWSLWDGTAVDVTDTSDPETLRRSRVAQLQKALLEAVGKVENRAQSQATVKPRVPSVTKRMRSLVVQKIRKSEQKDSTATTEEDIDGFWRLVDFQRRRADVVSLLRRNQFQHAKEQLCELEKWNHSRGKWHVESYAVEVSRSLNYLQAYANVKLVPVQRQADVLDVANETLESAKSHFVAAERGNPDAEHERVWMALRSHLEFEVQKTVEEIQKCDCKHKTQACGKHEENGAGVRYHNFMTVDGEDGEIQLPESAFNSLDPYSYRLDTIAEE